MTLGVAVLGTGRLGGRYIDVVKSTPGVQMVVVAEPRAEAAAPWKDKHPEVEFVADYREILERGDIDIVVATLPHWLHKQAAIDAARAGKHIYVEKPMAAWLADAQEMYSEAQANGVKVMTAHTQRYFPAVKAMKRVIDSGDLGSLVGMHDIWHFPYRPTQRPDWMLDRQLGGGMGQMAVTHQLDRLIWFAGNDIESVSARVGALTHPEYDKSDDSSFYLVRWKSGVTATINQVGWRRGATEYGGDLYFTDGMARFRLPYGGGETAKVWIADGNDGQWREEPVEDADSFLDEFTDFVRSIERGDADTPIPQEHGLLVLRVLEAGEESSRTGREVRL